MSGFFIFLSGKTTRHLKTCITKTSLKFSGKLKSKTAKELSNLLQAFLCVHVQEPLSKALGRF